MGDLIYIIKNFFKFIYSFLNKECLPKLNKSVCHRSLCLEQEKEKGFVPPFPFMGTGTNRYFVPVPVKEKKFYLKIEKRHNRFLLVIKK